MQRYSTQYLGLVRDSSVVQWDVNKGGGSEILPVSDPTALHSELISKYADQNRYITQEAVILTYLTYDETYTPISGDYIHDDFKWIGIVKPLASQVWEVYKNPTSQLVIETDKANLLTALRTNYGDGSFRIFNVILETNTHTLDVVV